MGEGPVPVWLLVLLGLLLFWGLQFLDRRAGGFDPLVYAPYRSHEELRALVPKAEGDLLYVSGQRIYGIYCSVCHQPTGQGLPGQFPPLAGADWVTTPGAGRLIRLLLNGLQGPITVNGQVYDGTMPAWRDLLKDEEIAAVLTFIRQNQIWGNSAAAVSPDQVKILRDRTAGRVMAWPPAELLQISAED